MNSTLTIAQKAYDLLSVLTPSAFITNTFSNGKNKCCVVGHYCRLTSDKPWYYSIENCSDQFRSNFSDNFNNLQERQLLRQVSKKYLVSVNIGNADISTINNQKCFGYQQETPYERSMALLKDMIAAGF